MPGLMELTQRHRAQQLLVRKSTAGDVAKLWPRLDGANLDASYPEFKAQVGSLIARNRQISAGLTSQYLRTYRSASGIPGTAGSIIAGRLNMEQFEASLRTTSVVAAKIATGNGDPLELAMNKALTQTTGAMARLALGGGRDTMIDTIRADPAARGFARVLGGNGCEFCQMLADRGAVYGEASVDFEAHDHCGCTGEPEYDVTAPRLAHVDVPAAIERLQEAASGPTPEPQYVDKIAGLLRDGKVTPQQLRADMERVSELGQANAQAALDLYEKELADIEAQRLARDGARQFSSAQDARNWADGHWAGPEGYTDDELQAMRDYTGSGYGPMNNTLRASKGKRTNAKIRAMDSAIERAPAVPDDITTVRNANLRQLGITTSKGDPRTLIGQEFVDHGYMSTSINRTGGMQGEVRLTLQVPKGTKGVYVSGKGGKKSASIISDYGGGESELILARGQHFRVVSVKKVGSRWHVVAEIVKAGVR